MKICKDGRIWGQNNKEAGEHLGVHSPLYYSFRRKGTASESKKGNKNPMYRKKHSKETKRKMSRLALGKNNPFYGKKHSEKTKEKLKSRIGKNNPNWRDGISKESYGLNFDREFKKLLRKRDYYICQKCDKTEKEIGCRLDCHHIDYNKKNDDPNNLVCLCRSCHMKTNSNRFYWILYFRTHKKEGEKRCSG